MKKKIYLYTFMSLLCVFSSASGAFAVSSEREPNILIYSHPVDAYVNIIIAEYLGSNGFNAIIINEEDEMDEILDTASWLGAFFLIETVDSEQDAFQITLTVYSTWNKETILNEVIKDSEFEAPLLEVIKVINKYLETEEVKIMIAELESAMEDTPEAVEKDEIIEPLVPEEDENFVKPAESAMKSFQLSVGAAPFISAFNVSDYFKTGFDFSLGGSWVLGLPFGEILLGGLVNYLYFNAEGTAASTTNHITSAGVDAQAVFNTDSVIKTFVSFSAGISLFDALVESGELYNSFLPFIFAGAGASIYFAEKFDFKLYIKYSMYMEKTILISGFSPSIGVTYKL